MDAASADVAAGLLRSEGVRVNVASDEPMPGLIQSWIMQRAPNASPKRTP